MSGYFEHMEMMEKERKGRTKVAKRKIRWDGKFRVVKRTYRNCVRYQVQQDITNDKHVFVKFGIEVLEREWQDVGPPYESKHVALEAAENEYIDVSYEEKVVAE